MLKDEPARKKTRLAEQRALVGTQERREKGQTTQEDYNDVMRLRREKLEGPKPH